MKSGRRRDSWSPSTDAESEATASEEKVPTPPSTAPESSDAITHDSEYPTSGRPTGRARGGMTTPVGGRVGCAKPTKECVVVVVDCTDAE